MLSLELLPLCCDVSRFTFIVKNMEIVSGTRRAIKAKNGHGNRWPGLFHAGATFIEHRFYLARVLTCQQRIALHSPMSTEPMPKSPICTGLHVAMRVRKGAGIGGSLVAAPIRLSIP